MRFLTSEQIKGFEGKVITDTDSSLCLINSAAHACAKELSHFGAICIFCGKGNNGADGYRLARILHGEGKRVRIVRVLEPSTAECKILADECAKDGISSVPFADIDEEFTRCDAAVDAIFGIGIRGEVTGTVREAIEYINGLNAFMLSVDIPSGLDTDSGEICGVSVRADKTVTFTAPKMGMLSPESVDCCGEIIISQVDIPADYAGMDDQPFVLGPPNLSALPKRPRLSHKGTFGRALMIVGSPGMLGAGAIAARAAMRSGVGLVTIVCKKGLENVINIMVPGAVVLPVEDYSTDDEPLRRAIESADSVLIGCGLGRSVTPGFIASVLEKAGCPVIIDADGLNTLAGKADMLRRGRPVITPHPLEFSRLTGRKVGDIEAERLDMARSFAAEYGLTLVLKGARTVVAHADGSASVSLGSTSALAKAGSGDVLSGVICALCAQGMDPEKAAGLGVYIHARSGAACARLVGEYSTTVDDIIDNLKYGFMEVSCHEKPWQGMGGN